MNGNRSSQLPSNGIAASGNQALTTQSQGQHGAHQFSYAAAVTQSHITKTTNSTISQTAVIDIQTETYIEDEEGEEGELVGSWNLVAANIRRQVREAPSNTGTTNASSYPRPYGNKPPLPLSAKPKYTKYPIVPSPPAGSPGHNYRGGGPGPVRAFYNDANREIFDVGYHDETQPPTGPREGRRHPRSPFSLARYQPATEKRQVSKRP